MVLYTHALRRIILRIETAIHYINEYCKTNNLPKARSLIEHNWTRITESRYYLHLNFNAQYLVKIIKEEIEKGMHQQLTLEEKRILNQMNQYVRDLRYSHAKKTYTKHKDLFNRSEVHNWLTSEAKMLCDAFIAQP